MYPLVNRCLRERWARVTATIYAPARVYTYAVDGGDGGMKQKEGTRGKKRERERGTRIKGMTVERVPRRSPLTAA